MSSERLSDNSELRRSQVAAFEESGLSQVEWCRRNGVSVTALRYWLRKLREEGLTSKSWVDIGSLAYLNTGDSCTSIIPVGCGSVTVRVGVFSVEVTGASDKESLRTALTVAASLC
jgi:hypothetical protein